MKVITKAQAGKVHIECVYDLLSSIGDTATIRSFSGYVFTVPTSHVLPATPENTVADEDDLDDRYRLMLRCKRHPAFAKEMQEVIDSWPVRLTAKEIETLKQQNNTTAFTRLGYGRG